MTRKTSVDGVPEVRVLVVDDLQSDAVALAFLLGLSLGGVQTRWAEGGERMFEEIESWQPHIVLTDAHMPRFDIFQALERLRRQWPLLPVVVVSGIVGDEMAARLIKAGANDFVAKPGTSRLPAVVERELREARSRAEKAELEGRLRQQQSLFELVLEHLPVGVWLVDETGTIHRGNPAGLAIWEGARYTDIDGYRAYQGWWADSGRAIEPDDWAAARAIRNGETSIDERIEIETFEGRRKVILNSAVPLRGEDGGSLGAFVVNQDITELHRTEQRLRRAERKLRGLSQRLLEVQEQERRWIAQELHDDIGQAIAAMRLQLANIAERSGSGPAAALAQEALRSSEQLGQRLRQICLGLRPLELDDFGLPAALRSLMASVDGPGLNVDFDVQGLTQRYPQAVETAAFRIAQEAVANALRHSGCTKLTVQLHMAPAALRLLVYDDGRGFDLDEAAMAAMRAHRFGLAGMEERALAAGGQLSLETAPGAGCTVSARFEPIAEDQEAVGNTVPGPLEPP
jgi:two-component system, NarL family, sensor histidine kinase UhpB